MRPVAAALLVPRADLIIVPRRKSDAKGPGFCAPREFVEVRLTSSPLVGCPRTAAAGAASLAGSLAGVHPWPSFDGELRQYADGL